MRRLLTTLVFLLGCVPCLAGALKIDPYTLPPVKAACGPEEPIPPPSAQQRTPPPLAVGKARIYFIGASQGRYRPRSNPVHLGIDGLWFGVNEPNTFSYVDIAPGVHHVCAATKHWFVFPIHQTFLGVVLARLIANAGETYYFLSGPDRQGGFALTPIDSNEARSFVKSLPSAHPETAETPASIPAKRESPYIYSHRNLPILVSEMQACGIPGKHTIEPIPVPDPTAGDLKNTSQIVVLFKAPKIFFHSPRLLDIGLDGHWAGSLPRAGWLAIQTSPGVHHLCVYINVMTVPNGERRAIFGLDIPGDSNLFILSSLIADSSDNWYTVSQLDPDEGALLTAFYPSANHPSH